MNKPLPNAKSFTRYFLHFCKRSDSNRTKEFAQEQYNLLTKGIRSGELHAATGPAWFRACEEADRATEYQSY